MRALLLIAGAAGVTAVLSLAHCQRAPAEEFAIQTTPMVSSGRAEAPSVASAAAASGRAPVVDASRCIRRTPLDPPPPVPLGPAAGCPPDPERTLIKPRMERVILANPVGHPQAVVEVEVVVSQHDTQRGLMYRKSMPEERGMLFDLRTRADHEFWMHNTCIPLDLLYVDEDGLIVGIVENAPTLDDSARGVGCDSRYVLEVNAGWSRRHGVKAGQQMMIPQL